MSAREPDDGDDIFDLVKKAGDIMDENEDLIRDLLGRSSSLDMGSDSPLSESVVEDDEVVIVADVGDADFESVKLDANGDEVSITVNGKTIEATVPDDTLTDDPDAQYNNGVLEVRFEREGGED